MLISSTALRDRARRLASEGGLFLSCVCVGGVAFLPPFFGARGGRCRFSQACSLVPPPACPCANSFLKGAVCYASRWPVPRSQCARDRLKSPHCDHSLGRAPVCACEAFFFLQAMIRFSTPLEEVPEGQPSLLERISVFLCRFPEEKDIFTNCVKDRVALAKGREELEAGTMPLDEYGVEQVPLLVGLLLLHLKLRTHPLVSCSLLNLPRGSGYCCRLVSFLLLAHWGVVWPGSQFQTEPLIASDVYEQCCQVVLSTKGSSTLCAALNSIIDGSLSAPRKRALRAFLNYLWVLQNSKAANGLDSIALATRFGNYMVRPPSGRDPILSRVKLMGALAILIESVPRTMGPKQSSVNDLLTRSSPSSSIDNSSGGSASPIFTSDKPHNSGSAKVIFFFLLDAWYPLNSLAPPPIQVCYSNRYAYAAVCVQCGHADCGYCPLGCHRH